MDVAHGGNRVRTSSKIQAMKLHSGATDDMIRSLSKEKAKAQTKTISVYSSFPICPSEFNYSFPTLASAVEWKDFYLVVIGFHRATQGSLFVYLFVR